MDKTASHILFEYGVQKRVDFYSRRPLFYSTDKPLTEVLLLTVVKFSSSDNLRLRRSKKNEFPHSREA